MPAFAVLRCDGPVHFFFFPALGVAGGDFHACFRAGLYPCVSPAGGLVDEDVVFSPLQVEMRGESFVPEEQFLSVSEVVSCSHVRLPDGSQGEEADGVEEMVEYAHFPFVFQAAVS